jgi:nitroreductase
MDYYGKLMPLFYRNDWFGFMTLLRKLIILVKGFNRPFLRVSSHADQRVMVHKSCALAAQTFMLSMASHQYDTCPMEGFDSRLVKKLIDAPAGAEVCMIVAEREQKKEFMQPEQECHQMRSFGKYSMLVDKI